MRSSIPPFFVVGASRSGTSLLRFMLDAHPGLALPDELWYFSKVSDAVPFPGAWWETHPASVVEHIFDRFRERSPRLFDAALWKEARASVAGRPATPRAPYQAVLEAYARREGALAWGEKTPSNVQWVDVLAAWFPTARFVFLVRDPRSVVASALRFPHLPNDPVVGAYNWLRANTRGHALVAALPPERWRLVRYEDLVSNPQSTLSGLAAFLGGEWDPSMLRFYEGATGAIGPNGPLPSLVTKPVVGNRADKWRDELDAETIAIVEAVCGSVMEGFGYTPSEHRLRAPARASVTARYLYCRVQTGRHAQGTRHPEFGFEPLARVRSQIRRLRSMAAH